VPFQYSAAAFAVKLVGSIDDPNGVGSTLVNGINAAGDLVGFYTDAAGNTDGMLATPDSFTTPLTNRHVAK